MGIPNQQQQSVIYLTAYDNNNLEISKKLGILGWKDKPSKLSIGDLAFVYDIDEHHIDCCFRIISESENEDPIWSDEVANGIIYKYRWNAELVADNLNFTIDSIYALQPFKKDKRLFSLLIRGAVPRSLEEPEYGDFVDSLIRRSNIDYPRLKKSKILQSFPRYWIFVVRDRRDLGLTADDILTIRTTDKFWALNKNTRNREKIRKGDRVVFSNGAKEFIGSAILTSDSFELSEEENKRMSHGKFLTDFGVNLNDIKKWKDPKQVDKLVNTLSFIHNKQHPESYFQGGIKSITREEFEAITGLHDEHNLRDYDAGKWLGVTSEDNWKQCIKHGLWGADANRLSQLMKVKLGDHLVVYLKEMKMAGICKVTREYFYDESEVWHDRIYPHRIGITKYKMPNQPIDIRKLYDDGIKPKLLSKGDNRGTPGGYFGQGIRPLPMDEYSTFESEIDKYIDSQKAITNEPDSETFEDTPLGIPEKDYISTAIKKIREELFIDEDTILQIVVNLAAGRHIILAGPVGTGKTSLALMIPKLSWKGSVGYYPEVYTANAEWSTHDVIGGIIPRVKEDGNPTYEIILGCVSESVTSNWSKNQPDKRTSNIHEDKEYRGTWLVIDEFNRADIDKAFGALFTALETRNLKIPTSKSGNSFDVIRIPLDYRIIGTLNTADKHFLFKLSDALKRRFAYIEIFPPKQEQKETEIFYALKNALRALNDEEHNYFGSLLLLDANSKTIDRTISNKELLGIIDKAYEIIHFIRLTKVLGTAILKSIYQTMLVAYRVTWDYKKSLDIALNANLIPQLENVHSTTLQTIFQLFFGDALTFFKEKYASHEKDQYIKDFSNFLECINAEDQPAKVRAFSDSQNKMDQGFWNSINNSQNKNKKYFSSQIFKAALEDLIKTTPYI